MRCEDCARRVRTIRRAGRGSLSEIRKIVGKSLESVADAMSESNRKLYKFGDFEVDPQNRLLLRGSEIISATPKCFDLLLLFLENPGALLEKEDLMARVWGQTIVEEGNLARNISTLRKTLGENPRQPEYIVTVAGHGYRFTARVEQFSIDGEQLIQPGNERVIEEAVASVEKKGPDPSDFRPASEHYRHWRVKSLVVATIGFVTFLAVILAVVSLKPKKADPPTLDAVKTIAVLPAKPSSPEDGDPASEFGLAASLISRLSGIRSFIVRPAAAIAKYASIEQDPIAIGKEQQVNYVLAPTYQKVGEKVALTARLIDVRDGSVLWSDTCEDQCSTFAWQDALAEKTARSLVTGLRDPSFQALTKHSTENQKAFDLYSLALYGWYRNNYDIDGLLKSAGYLEQAIKLDPNYASAYALLATINSRVGQSLGAERKEYEQRAEEFAHKALDLDPMLIQAYLVLGVSAYSYHWDWKRAEEYFANAQKLNPDDVEVVRTYAPYLASIGELDASIFWQQRACKLQPTSFDLKSILVMRLFIAHHYEEAIDQAQIALKMIETTPTLYYLWRSYEQQRMYKEAFETLQKLAAAEKDQDMVALLQRTYAASGYEKARELYVKRMLKNLQKNADQERFNPLEPAMYCALLGNREEAFTWLERAFQQRVQGLIYLQHNPDFDSLRSDPRFADLIHRIGFPVKEGKAESGS